MRDDILEWFAVTRETPGCHADRRGWSRLSSSSLRPRAPGMTSSTERGNRRHHGDERHLHSLAGASRRWGHS